jgi:hypothetical protein
MTRRKALKIFGALFVCLAGRTTVEAKEMTDVTLSNPWAQPTTYTFSEGGIKDIIIEKKDGSKLIVPFSDIVEALEA